jgi:hypothetical protein
MIRTRSAAQSGYRFSEKIMLKEQDRAGMAIRRNRHPALASRVVGAVFLAKSRRDRYQVRAF